jgi:predicted transcriptional regulator
MSGLPRIQGRVARAAFDALHAAGMPLTTDAIAAEVWPDRQPGPVEKGSLCRALRRLVARGLVQRKAPDVREGRSLRRWTATTIEPLTDWIPPC